MPPSEYHAWIQENTGMKFLTVFGVGFLMGLAAAGSAFTIKLDATGAIIQVDADDILKKQKRPNGPEQWVPVNPPRL